MLELGLLLLELLLVLLPSTTWDEELFLLSDVVDTLVSLSITKVSELISLSSLGLSIALFSSSASVSLSSFLSCLLQ